MRNGRRLALAAIVGSLGACASAEPMAPVGGEYDAIRFRRLVRVNDHGINTWGFLPGSLLIADRRTSFGTVYCGAASLNSGAMTETCIGFKPPATIVIGPGGGFRQIDRPIDPDAIERIKVRS